MEVHQVKSPILTVGVLCCLMIGVACWKPRPAPHPGTSEGVPTGAVPSQSSPTDVGVSPGYVLFSPLLSGMTYLIDRRGLAVHTWASEYAPGASVYLLAGGNLLRPARDPGLPMFSAGGQGGRIQQFTWEGELLWDFVIGGPDRMQHHDIEPLPNGNVLVIVWETRTREQALRAGRRPDLVPEQGLFPDAIVEIEPLPPDDGRIVWLWHVWDHLIQDLDPDLPGYGRVADHPELVDINGDQRRRRVTDAVLDRLKALGYATRGATPADARADLLHTNSIAYNPALDQIMLSVLNFNEVWIIDHGTTTSEAASHAGGRAGKGGDLLFRWGNPQAYGRGTDQHRQLFGQHDARGIPAGVPGAGNIMIFNNGVDRPGGAQSSVIELSLPVDGKGRYTAAAGEPFGPARPVWRYPGTTDPSFFADFISGAARLPNGNTIVCDGPRGRFLEVTPDGKQVWEYHNPYTGDAPNPAGDPARSVFRVTNIPPDHTAVAGRHLPPLDPQPPPIAAGTGVR